jgi:hypothetical protein
MRVTLVMTSRLAAVKRIWVRLSVGWFEHIQQNELSPQRLCPVQVRITVCIFAWKYINWTVRKAGGQGWKIGFP